MTEQTTGWILVAADGSQPARNAAQAAIKLAQMQGYGLHALYVVDEALALETYSDFHRELTFTVDPEVDDDPMALLEAQGALALDQVEVMARKANVPVQMEMLLGNVEDLILDRANGALMIALGRRGNRHADKPDHLGEHFWRVAHKAAAPVIVGGDIAPDQIQHLLFGFTGDEYDIRALHGLTVLQRDLKADVIVVLGNNPDEAQAQQWREQALARIAEEDRAHYRFLRRPEKLADALIAAIREEDVDLIVMSEHHRRLALLDELLGGPLDTVLAQTQQPVIIVR